MSKEAEALDKERARYIIAREFTTSPYRVYKRTTYLQGHNTDTYVYFEKVIAKEPIGQLVAWSGNDYKEALKALKRTNESNQK